jgi:kynureninase
MAASIAQLQTVEDGHGFIETLELSYPGSAAWTVRLCNDTRSWTIADQEWTALPFRISLPSRLSGESPKASVIVDNVGREMMQLLEALPFDAQVNATMAVRSRATPATVEYQFTAALSGIVANQTTVSGTISVDTDMQRPAVLRRFDPTHSPGVFAG